VPLARWIPALACLLAAAACATPTHGATPPVGGARPVTVVTPPGYDEDSPAPLLLVLHGYGATPAEVGDFLRLKPAAAKAGMIYAAPAGTRDGDNKLFWNATAACCAPGEKSVDDSAYLESVIEDIKEKYAVDPRRIYVAGHSNGGFMAHRLACDHGGTIAAIASAAGAGFADPAACKPSKPVAVLQIQGDADASVAYHGGELSAPYPGAEETVRDWAKRDGCQLTPIRGKPIDYADRADSGDDSPALPGPETITESYGHCKPGGHAELWAVIGAGHTPVLAADAPKHIIDFFLAHPKP
jgi:polyhydroxybutyrate depolymerase